MWSSQHYPLAIFILVLFHICFQQNEAATAAKPQPFALVQSIAVPPECDSGDWGGFDSVAMSGDGFTAAAGCYAGYEYLGLVVVFIRSPSTALWTQQAILNGTDKPEYAQEGYPIALSSDGNTLVSSVNTAEPSPVFIYGRDNNGVWSQEARLLGPYPTGPRQFGVSPSISADGNTLAVILKEPIEIYIYIRNGTNWDQQAGPLVPNDGSELMGSVAISPDGKTVVAPSLSDSGLDLIQIFQFSNGEWAQPAVPSSNVNNEDTWLWSLAFAEGTQYVLSVEISNFVAFAFNGTGYEQAFNFQETVESESSVVRDIATDTSGRYAMGTIVNDQITVFWRKSTNPLVYEPYQNITMANTTGFGNYVSMSADGRWVVTIGLGTHLYIYERPTSEICKPRPGVNKATCQRRINACIPEGAELKWTGAGCRRQKRKEGDGGCQCKGYCGYTCKKACNKDKQCKWMNGLCHSKQTSEPGHAMPICY